MSEQEQPESTAERTHVKVKTSKGDCDVPALIHPNAPGLAVTMCGFGIFEVTHIPTGLKLTHSYERMGTALLLMSQYAKIASTYNFNWNELNQEQSRLKMTELADEQVPFEGYTNTSNGETKPGLIKDWMRTLKMYSFDSIIGEFPWEESNPLDEAFEALSAI